MMAADQVARCIYCGAPADTVEHVVPVSFFGLTREQGLALYPRDLPTFSACRECNSMLSRCEATSLAGRAAVLAEKIEKKYRRAMTATIAQRLNNVRHWSDKEPKDLMATTADLWADATAEEPELEPVENEERLPGDGKCIECGADLKGKQTEFCSTPCKTARFNRERARGQLLYRLYSATRYDRKRHPNLSTVNSLMSEWRRQDVAAGRQPFRPVECADLKAVLAAQELK